MDLDASEIRAAIADDRVQLATTVAALSEKADIKKRVRSAAKERSAAVMHSARGLGRQIIEMAPGDGASAASPTLAKARGRSRAYAVVAVAMLVLRVIRHRRRKARRKKGAD